ncbi:MAG: hypothetical protein IKZ87_00165 [Actinomycetaceae bacterium]|nr:hypothetical protein [Actinomycetaceae bacterium]
MDVFQLLYRDVEDAYGEDYIQTGNIYCIGVFSTREAAMNAVKADMLDVAGGVLATREDVPDADEGMVRIVDGEPRGFYEIRAFPLDKLAWQEIAEFERV